MLVGQTLKWQRILLAVAAALVPLTFFPTSRGDIYGVTKATVFVLCAVLCLAIGIGRQIRERQIVLPRLWCTVAAGCFAAALVITTITSTTPMQSVVGEYQQYAGMVGYLAGLVLFLTAARSNDKNTLIYLMLTIVGAAAIITLYGFLQWAGHDPWDLGSSSNVISTMGNTNFLAGWIGIALPICLAVALAPIPSWLRITGLVTGVLIIPLARATKAFQGPATVGGALVAFGVLLLATGAVRIPLPRHVTPGRAVALVVVVLVVLAPFGFKPLRHGIDQGLLERKYFWRVATEVFLDHPIVGTGPDTFHNQYLERRPKAHAAVPFSKNAGAAHSVPLDLLANGGILLGGSYLAFVLLVGWRLVVAVRRRTAPGWMVAGLGAAWIAYQLQSLVSIDRPPLLATHFILAGAVVAVSGPLPARVYRLPGWRDEEDPIATLGTIIGVSVVAVLAAVAGWFVLRPIRADMAASAAREAIDKKLGDAAEQDLDRARHLAPWEATFTFDQVRLYSLANVPDKALRAAKEGARLEPGDSSYFLVVAELADALKKPDLAATWYDKALKVDPYGTDILKAAALSAARADDTKRADELVDRLLDVTRTRADVWDTVGQARQAEGRTADAKAAFEKALEIAPGDKVAETGLKQLGQ